MFFEPKVEILRLVLPLAVVVVGELGQHDVEQVQLFLGKLGELEAGSEWDCVLLDFPTFKHGDVLAEGRLRKHRVLGGRKRKEHGLLVVVECHIQEVVLLEESAEVVLGVVYAAEPGEVYVERGLSRTDEVVYVVLHPLQEAQVLHPEVHQPRRIVYAPLLVQYLEPFHVFARPVALDVPVNAVRSRPALHQLHSGAAFALD